MSLKRSRKEMGNKVALANKTMKPKKKVQFNEATTTISAPPPEETTDDFDATPALLWYTRSELTLQLEEARKPIPQLVSNGYGLLVANSYLTPHIAVQEYLNAFCAGTHTAELRGLESNLAADLRDERSQTRKAHVAAVLAAQKRQGDTDALYACSRQSSAPSKLFAMRMGRADARWEEESGEAAQELVDEQLAKLNGGKSRASSISTASSTDHSYASLICVQQQQDSMIVTLPVQEIVVGKFPQSQAAA